MKCVGTQNVPFFFRTKGGPSIYEHIEALRAEGAPTASGRCPDHPRGSDSGRLRVFRGFGMEDLGRKAFGFGWFWLWGPLGLWELWVWTLGLCRAWEHLILHRAWAMGLWRISSCLTRATEQCEFWGGMFSSCITPLLSSWTARQEWKE